MPSLRHQPAADALFDEAFMASLEYLEIVAKRAFQGVARGERRARRMGAGLEFADYRRYSPGDDFRHIDWNVYARLGKLLLRLFDEEEDLTVYLLLDGSSSMGLGDGGRFDQARRLAAALAYVTLANLDRVSLVALSDSVDDRLLPARGPRSAPALRPPSATARQRCAGSPPGRRPGTSSSAFFGRFGPSFQAGLGPFLPFWGPFYPFCPFLPFVQGVLFCLV